MAAGSGSISTFASTAARRAASRFSAMTANSGWPWNAIRSVGMPDRRGCH